MNFLDLSDKFYEWLTYDLMLTGTKAELIHLFSAIVFLAALCFIFWWIVRQVIIRIVKKVVTKTENTWDDKLFEYKVFRTLSLIVIAVVIYRAIPVVVRDFPDWTEFLLDAARVYIIISVAVALNSILNALGDIMESYPSLSDKPIRSYKQVAKIIFFLFAFVLILSIVIGQSPLYVLGGFGAVTAVLILIFRDPILGFVASIQMSAIDLVRIGDWITVEKFGADGEVVEINLTTVKVQNWDKTITLVPSYALVSDSFKNWRGMQQSDGRRIKRHINIKIDSIKFCDDDLYARLLKVERIRDYLKSRAAEVEEFNKSNRVDKSVLVNGRHLTNIGIFRVYAEKYLEQNPDINTEMDFMVRQLQPNENGLPIEIYAFSRKKKWEEYELVMADVFDHLLAAVPFFDLEIFQNPSGSDMAAAYRKEENEG